MKKLALITGLLSMTISFSALAASSSCSEQLQALLENSANTGIVDGRESELRDQLNNGSIKEESKADLSARVELLQSVRLKLQDGAGEKEVSFIKKCLK